MKLKLVMLRMIASCAAHACSLSEAKRDFNIGDLRAIMTNIKLSQNLSTFVPVEDKSLRLKKCSKYSKTEISPGQSSDLFMLMTCQQTV